MTVVNHVGLCVRDLDRSRRFYTEALGFAHERERDIHPPDEATGPLLSIDPPVGATAQYLTLGAFTLELLHFDRAGNPDPRAREFTETGLTHLSIGVDDIPATLARVRAAGGEVIESSDIGLAVMVRDPDGQLVELLPTRTVAT